MQSAPFAPLEVLPDQAALQLHDFFKRAEIIAVAVPRDLHVETKRLIQAFAVALADKARAAEIKEGYSDEWLINDWEVECWLDLLKHLEKGDPRDVAIYCAFMWARGWPTKGRK